MIDSIATHDVRAFLAQAGRRDEAATAKLNAIVASWTETSHRMDRLDILRAQIGTHAVTTRKIDNDILLNASTNASNISRAVQRLDIEQARVQKTLGVADQVAELKACVLGVTGSMGAPQDWEQAARYLNRASKIPDEIVRGPFAEQLVPTAEVPDPPAITLSSASESLLTLFSREFEKAAQEGNGAKVTRFFKLFPLINKFEYGLEVYGRYVCQGVALRARDNISMSYDSPQRRINFPYANALTKLFEHIAQIIEYHGGLVEHHYGTGSMVKIIERLQGEADIQGAMILELLTNDRKIEQKLTEIKSYAFNFLVQSFLPNSSTKSGINRSGSPAIKSALPEVQSSAEEIVDMKEMDSLLSEMTIVLSRWSSYTSFIATKCKRADDASEELRIPVLIISSSLQRDITDRLISPFGSLSTFFFRRSVEKAFQIDESPADLSLDSSKPLKSSPPYISSVVDDVMYMVNQVIERSLATSQRAVISTIIPAMARVLGSDFVGMIQRKMRDENYPRAAVAGSLPPEQTTLAFLVLLNDLDIATEYVKRIIQPHVDEISGASVSKILGGAPRNELKLLFPLEQDSHVVFETLQTLQSSFETKARELQGDGIFVILKTVIKPRLRSLLADTFRDVDYQPTQREAANRKHTLASHETNVDALDNEVARRFQEGWEHLLKPCTRILTERNVDGLLAQICCYLGEVLEKRIWTYYGRLNEFGGVRLERDVGSIISTVVRDGKYELRNMFSRCTQICLIMNMEDEEWKVSEALTTQSSDVEDDWLVTANERVRARAMVLRD